MRCKPPIDQVFVGVVYGSMWFVVCFLSFSHGTAGSHSYANGFANASSNRRIAVVVCGAVDLAVINAGELLPVPPDGGWGWVIVAASFLANMVVDGIAYSFGILFPEFHAYFGKAKQETAWIGSLLTGVYMLIAGEEVSYNELQYNDFTLNRVIVLGPFVSGLVNKFGAKAVMIAGSLIACLGFVISVFVRSLPLMMLFYGICGGVGFGFIYLPACVYVGYYFEKKRALATGIAVAGSGLGTLLILAGIIANCAVFGCLMRPLEHPKSVKRLPHTGQNMVEKINTSTMLLHSNNDVELKPIVSKPAQFKRFHSSLSESYAADVDVHASLLSGIEGQKETKARNEAKAEFQNHSLIEAGMSTVI
ncbi:unnamed protein product [Soboliphyme baturini]|uniref:MFS domain-containing protein n=1 Tax=Soboliphyme baturini TaxID=241478 RepID=A0A183ID16_9BILA|nr:unnamed protein product [Soboliphyme baturini]